MEIPKGFPENTPGILGRPEYGTHILIGRTDLVVCIWKAWLMFNVIDPG